MRKTYLMSLVVCLAAMTALPAFAQSAPGLRLNLPYAVRVGKVTLPAGECTVSELKDSGNETFFLIRTASGPSVDVRMERDPASDQSNTGASSVELRHLDGKYELAGLRIGGRIYKVGE